MALTASANGSFDHGAVRRSRSYSLQQAIRTTLDHNPNIRLQQQQTHIAWGSYRQEAGRFDPDVQAALSHSRERTPLLKSEQTSDFDGMLNTEIADLSTLSASISKEFHNGIIVGPKAEWTRLDSNIKDFDGLKPENRADVDFGISIPLLKGRFAGANADAAKINHDAAVNDLYHSIATNVLTTIRAYWLYAGAYQRLRVLQRSEKRAAQLTKNIKRLIAADEVPPAELNLSLANLAEKKAKTIAAQQNLIVARQNLGVATGLPYQQAYYLPLPSNHFPALKPRLIRHSKNLQRLNALALQLRKDVMAERQRLHASTVIVRATHNDLHPKLDVSVTAGYSGLHEGHDVVAPLHKNVTGLNAFGEISYQFPIGNNAAHGDFLSSSAQRDSITIRLRDLIRTIKLDISTAAADVQNSTKQLRQATTSVKYYHIAVSNEAKKIQYGISTLVALLRVEDQLIDASLAEVDTHVEYANALAQLQFETGTLIKGNQKSSRVSLTYLL